jgi:hypothetical protein
MCVARDRSGLWDMRCSEIDTCVIGVFVYEVGGGIEGGRQEVVEERLMRGFVQFLGGIRAQ